MAVTLQKFAVPLRETEPGVWTYLAPYNVAVTYTACRVLGWYLVTETTHTPEPDAGEWTAGEQVIAAAWSLSDAAQKIATAFHRDYC